MSQLVTRLTATIANGAILSNAIQIAGRRVRFIEMPIAWTPAVLSFQGSMDGVSYFNLYDDEGYPFTVFVDILRRVYLYNTVLDSQQYIKLISGTVANTVAQGAARTIYVEVWST